MGGSSGDEGEWVIAPAKVDGDEDIDRRWLVMKDGDDEDVSRLAFGVCFLSRFGLVVSPFSSVGLRVPSLMALSTFPCCSAGGLLVLSSNWSRYYVMNPSTTSSSGCRKLTSHPVRPHIPEAPLPLALVLDPSSANYYIVAAAGSKFFTNSSASGCWSVTKSEILRAHRAVPGSGVSALGVAYWRTVDGSVIGFNPATEVPTLFPPPVDNAAVLWQLGKWGGRLCCGLATGQDVALLLLELEDGGRWVRHAGVKVDTQDRLWPIRFEGEDLEVLLIAGRKMVAVNFDNSTVRREAELSCYPNTDTQPEDFVPYTKSRASPCPLP